MRTCSHNHKTVISQFKHIISNINNSFFLLFMLFEKIVGYKKCLNSLDDKFAVSIRSVQCGFALWLHWTLVITICFSTAVVQFFKFICMILFLPFFLLFFSSRSHNSGRVVALTMRKEEPANEIAFNGDALRPRRGLLVKDEKVRCEKRYDRCAQD